ncbi:MAG: glycine--tRNA ligase subunit beta [Peptococcaceae bacterium]|jgi:glycyl-tRNA synthetase beta chain|nr:glycine--tRNA ligase subunit beta [Peptococcaceae bacterium]MDH7524557.1 glycine--tRNA ligase subunit beta [Peptococcaceae bacterium]
MANYLLEIGTEEIPARFMPGTLAQLEELAAIKFGEYRLKYGQIHTLGTPRRITLLVYDLAEKGEDLQEEVKGPSRKAAFGPDGQPTRAAEGFARSQGVSLDKLILKNTGSGEYVFALRQVEGRAAREVLPEIALQLIRGLSFPKSMRWADKEMRFARPIHWLVSLLDREVIPFEMEGLTAGRTTRGHRFLGRGSIEIIDPLTYVEQLKEGFVMVEPKLRREECWRQIKEAAERVGGRVEMDEELLEEITYLLEWPTALTGSFDREYLSMPEEVVITPMKEHQRYFPVRGSGGELLNHFITVRDGNDAHLEIVSAGNEKVLRARLADARFFWDDDRKVKLEQYLPRLEKIVFQESLGTVAQKVERIINSVGAYIKALGLTTETGQNALRAAQLAKADLVTSMVYEFPELQGIMGQYYAVLSGERKEVARAIMEHYQPRFAGDAIPQSVEGALVSLADKIDTIAGCFAIGIEPTGSQDPYALRRQAMGICHIIIGHSFELNLDDLIGQALENYRGVLPDRELGEEMRERVREFFQARLKNILGDEGHRYDVIEAVLGVDYSNFLTVKARAEALSRTKDDPGFREMLTSFTRAYNLTRKTAACPIQPQHLADKAEKELYAVLQEVEKKLPGLEKQREFVEIIRLLSPLSGPVDRFFNAVLVMVDDEKVRNNRLALLHKVVELTRGVGDLSRIAPSL